MPAPGSSETHPRTLAAQGAISKERWQVELFFKAIKQNLMAQSSREGSLEYDVGRPSSRARSAGVREESLMLPLLLLQLATAELPSAEAPVRALVEARDLLRARKFTELTALMESRQRAAAQDPDSDDEFEWVNYAFRSRDPELPPLLDEWAHADKTSWAPLLARAINRRERAAEARGGAWAQETSESQFHAMRELLAGMRTDCAVALARRPDLCPCHVEIVIAEKMEDPDPEVFEAAMKACPKSYGLHVERVFGLTPRWGGSYEEMKSAADEARKLGLPTEQVRNLEAYIPSDTASMLLSEGKAKEALKVLDAAILEWPAPVLLMERASLHSRLKAPAFLRTPRARPTPSAAPRP